MATQGHSKSAPGRPGLPAVVGGKPATKATIPQRPRGKMTGAFVTLILAGLVVAVVAFPTFVVICCAMLPTLTAFVTDRNPKRTLVLTVLPPNLFAALVVLIPLWTGENTVSQAMGIIENPFVWVGIYVAAGLGWALHMGMPAVVNAFKETKLEAERAGLVATLTHLREEWGEDVGPADEPAPTTSPPAGQAKPN